MGVPQLLWWTENRWAFLPDEAKAAPSPGDGVVLATFVPTSSALSWISPWGDRPVGPLTVDEAEQVEQAQGREHAAAESIHGAIDGYITALEGEVHSAATFVLIEEQPDHVLVAVAHSRVQRGEAVAALGLVDER